VADLVEMCFPIHLDPDGQMYVREMRKTARQMQLLSFVSDLIDAQGSKAAGFVCEDDGRVIGNLSLIPFQKDRQRIHLIANVAVHPDYRRQGIARALTERAVGYLRRQNEPSVWLQVSEDNEAAIHLYRSIGFEAQLTRTTWRIRPFEFKREIVPPQRDAKVTRWGKACWESQQRWLDANYPALMRWNLQVNFNQFDPGWMRQFLNILEGVRLKHWVVKLGDQCAGVLTWQKSNSFADNLWLAFPEETEQEALPKGLHAALRFLPSRHPVSVDYPKGRFQDQFEALGFTLFRTLIWMRCQL
jgi:ribosomal protein S18 acetylase RimI-like enzyme